MLSKGAKSAPPLQRKHLSDRCGERGLAVIDMPNRADVYVRLGSFKSLLRHPLALSLLFIPKIS